MQHHPPSLGKLPLDAAAPWLAHCNERGIETVDGATGKPTKHCRQTDMLDGWPDGTSALLGAAGRGCSTIGCFNRSASWRSRGNFANCTLTPSTLPTSSMIIWTRFFRTPVSGLHPTNAFHAVHLRVRANDML